MADVDDEFTAPRAELWSWRTNRSPLYKRGPFTARRLQPEEVEGYPRWKGFRAVVCGSNGEPMFMYHTLAEAERTAEQCNLNAARRLMTEDD